MTGEKICSTIHLERPWQLLKYPDIYDEETASIILVHRHCSRLKARSLHHCWAMWREEGRGPLQCSLQCARSGNSSLQHSTIPPSPLCCQQRQSNAISCSATGLLQGKYVYKQCRFQIDYKRAEEPIISRTFICSTIFGSHEVKYNGYLKQDTGQMYKHQINMFSEWKHVFCVNIWHTGGENKSYA